jgi:hypothetical protein
MERIGEIHAGVRPIQRERDWPGIVEHDIGVAAETPERVRRGCGRSLHRCPMIGCIC